MALKTNVLYGKKIVLNSNSNDSNNVNLKWTISQTQPTDSIAGDLWVQGTKATVTIKKIIHVQTNGKEIANAEPNAIYVLTPDVNYPVSPKDVTVKFFDGKKYSLELKCPYVLVTDSDGTELDVVRGIYTGTDWRIWDNSIPEPPAQDEWEFLEAINKDMDWTPPVPNVFYRIHVFGKCGDGSYKHETSSNNFTASGGASGNTGGYACSVLMLDDKPISCTVNTSITTFGDYLSATSGASVPDRSINPPAILGQGIGGTEYNLEGIQGVPQNTPGNNNGCSLPVPPSVQPGSGGKTTMRGGGGSRMPTPYENFPYVPSSLGNFYSANGAYLVNKNANMSNGSAGTPYPSLDLKNPKVYGSGSGHGGFTYGGTTSENKFGSGGSRTLGSPALIIIEKRKGS